MHLQREDARLTFYGAKREEISSVCVYKYKYPNGICYFQMQLQFANADRHSRKRPSNRMRKTECQSRGKRQKTAKIVGRWRQHIRILRSVAVCWRTESMNGKIVCVWNLIPKRRVVVDAPVVSSKSFVGAPTEHTHTRAAGNQCSLLMVVTRHK